MKRIQHVFKVGLLLSTLILLFSYSNNPPNGKTGAPAERNCMECHTPTNPDFDGEFEVLGLPQKLLPNHTYNLTARMTVTNGTPQRAGFQLVALGGNNINAGSMVAQSSNCAIENSGGRVYVEHSSAPNFVDDLVEFHFQWVSPDNTGMDSVIFYASSVLGDGTGTAGDKVLPYKRSTFLSDNQPISVGFTSEDVTCFRGSDGSATVNASGGFGNFTYLWSNGDTIETATNLSAGIYEVTVTDEFGHSTTTPVEIKEPQEILFNEVVSDLTTIGGSDGTISLIPTGGTPGYTYLWPQTGDTSSTLSNLPFGPRWVIVADNNGCVKTDTFQINNPFCDLEVADIQTIDVSCFGKNDGEVSISLTGGTPPFTFDFGGNSPTSLSAGTYSVTILDAINCGVIDSFEINQPSEIEVGFESNLNCDGLEVNLSVMGGVPPYEYLWSDGSTDSTNVILGALDVDITDSNGCLIEVFSNIAIIDPLDVLFDSVSLSMETIMVTTSGGESPFIYTWTDESGVVVSNDEDLTGISNGTYTLVVEDAVGCLDTLEVEVSGISSVRRSFAFKEKGKVFPNPTSDHFTVEFEEIPKEKVGFKLYDSRFGLALTKHPSIINRRETDISVGHLVSGLYFLKIQIGDKVYFQELIIQSE